MSLRYHTVSFLSDYGLVDEFVGSVHSVIRSLAPEVRVIDVTHQVPRHDVRAGALTLARAAQYLAPGVVVAVVDPGVGSERRRIAVEVGGGDSILVGPDNGLLAPAVAMVGGATRAVVLSDTAYHLEAPGPTFDGRDVFAPVAAHLCMGVPLGELGEELDPLSLRPMMVPITYFEGDVLKAEALWVDHFGNVQLNVDPDEVDDWGELIRIDTSDASRTARRVSAYQELRTGEVGIVVDSYGLLAIVLDQASAAAELGIAAGDGVDLHPLGEEQRDATAVAVELRSRSER